MMYYIFDNLHGTPYLMASVTDRIFARSFVFRRNAYYRIPRFYYTDKTPNGTQHYCLTL